MEGSANCVMPAWLLYSTPMFASYKKQNNDMHGSTACSVSRNGQ
ncbi:hypothetical protein RE6C_03922 [Rhodopirellula europaea 6C]|uniref:Uncharacterized protein n=1 Tax=Rhodopirellula europaea 6C TaxID=1263867 RepID=M2A5C5_9BACT|nr:hypothetical protein RE6C_03922 [Rhodopirellula europaea 6C]